MKSLVFRATWAGPDPAPGEFLLTRRAELAYRIEGVSRGAHLQLSCAPIPVSELAQNAVLHPWQWRERRKSGIGANCAFAAEVAARIQGQRSRAKGAEERRAIALLHDGNPLVPEVRKVRVTAGKRVLREPTATVALWRDPDDHNPRSRAPRMIAGFKRHSVLDRLCKPRRSKSAPIAPEHVRAAGQYALHAELAERCPQRLVANLEGSGGGSGIRQPLGFDVEQSHHRRCLAAARKALGTQGTMLLDAVVLQNVDIGTYADATGLEDDVALGVLVATLDRLLEHFGGAKALRPTVFEEVRHAR